MTVDYCKIFSDRVDYLYTLALLLTADHGKAEQCFVAGLEDCVQGNSVFREWAEAWAARTIIKNAIRMMSPLRTETATADETDLEPRSQAETLAFAITKLPPLERFVYVMSVLEKYSDRECALLLDCKLEEITNARTHAFERLNAVAFLGGQQAPDLVNAELSGSAVALVLRTACSRRPSRQVSCTGRLLSI